MTPDCCAAAAPEGPLGVALLLGTGVTMSLGHCLGMCGPLAVAFGVRQHQAGRSRHRLVPPLLVYHAGRLTSYAIIGALVAAVVSMPGVNLDGTRWRAWFSLFAALVLLASAFGIPLLPRITPRPAWLERARALHRRWSLAAGKRGHFGLGVANGVLPCGPVGAIALAAATLGSVWKAAGAMVLFGIGTLPALAIVAWSAGSVAPRAQLAFRRTANVLIVLLAFQLSMRGLAALDVVAHQEVGSWMLW